MFSPVNRKDHCIIFAITGVWVIEYVGNRPFSGYLNDLGQRFIKVDGDWFLWCPLADTVDAP